VDAFDFPDLAFGFVSHGINLGVNFFLGPGANPGRLARFKRYSRRLANLRGIRKYVYRMDVLARDLSYDEVTEIFVRVNSLGAELRSSDLALAQITAKGAINNKLPKLCGTP
jgi:hypothetical protein